MLAWSYGQNNYSFILACCLLLSTALHAAHKVPRIFTNVFSRNLVLFVTVCVISAAMAQDTSLSTGPLYLFLKIIIMVLVVPLLIEDYQSLRIFIVVIAGSLGILCLKFGIYGLYYGGVQFA